MGRTAIGFARGTRALAAGVLGSIAILGAGAGARAAEEVWPSRVAATYKVTVAGFEIGTFKFTSTLGSQGYTLTGQGNLSWGFGMFGWSSETRASGAIDGERVMPAGYTLDYKSSAGKSGTVKMAFLEGGVRSVSIVPPMPPAPGAIPVREHHLKAVLDPMSAILAMAHGTTANPCGRRISIFDGRQRFDLALSFRRQERAVEKRPSGQPTIAYVCRVQYIPVAGHRHSSETQAMASNGGIEVAVRPVPAAALLLPTRVTLPTSMGIAELTLQQAEIAAPGNKTIALSH